MTTPTITVCAIWHRNGNVIETRSDDGYSLELALEMAKEYREDPECINAWVESVEVIVVVDAGLSDMDCQWLFGEAIGE